MDNLQFWLYVIIAVIFVLGRLFKKSNQPTRSGNVPRERQPERTSTPESRPLTFEELLREITESKSTTPKPSYSPPKPVQTQKKSPYVDYDDDLKEEAEDLEDVDYDYRKKDKDYYNVYEEAKKQAFLRPSLEETPNLQENELKYTKFKEFSRERKRTILDEYVEELRSPSGFKKAIVLSEILKPRF